MTTPSDIREKVSDLTAYCQTVGDKAGLGKFLSAHVSKNQVLAIFVHGCVQLNTNGTPIDLKKFN